MECALSFLPLQPGSFLLSFSLSLSLCVCSVWLSLQLPSFFPSILHIRRIPLVWSDGCSFFPPLFRLPMARVALHDRSAAVVLGRLISL